MHFSINNMIFLVSIAIINVDVFTNRVRIMYVLIGIHMCIAHTISNGASVVIVFNFPLFILNVLLRLSILRLL